MTEVHANEEQQGLEAQGRAGGGKKVKGRGGKEKKRMTRKGNK